LPEGTTVEVNPNVSANATRALGDPENDDAALLSGSISAVRALLPSEDFSDWEK